ncbi:hypothetical protein TNCV_2869021 [Trichonephila clavipes]|nr:hypothetical protein TNCV_2869021 [Trichonephila clavipes]
MCFRVDPGDSASAGQYSHMRPDRLPLQAADGQEIKEIGGLPDVRFSTGQSSFLHVSPVKRIWVNRTKECPVLNTFCVISGALGRQPTQRVGL